MPNNRHRYDAKHKEEAGLFPGGDAGGKLRRFCGGSMPRTRCLALLLLSVSLTASAQAQTQTAFTTKISNVRAGPSREFPVVIRLGPSTPVQVVGCMDDWTWCDVIAAPDRGWIYAGNIAFPYQGNHVIVRWAGPTLGFPAITFSVGSYWDLYYRTRPWYSRRSYWVGRPPPPRWPYPSKRPPSIQVPPPRPNPPRPNPPRPGPRPPSARPTPRPTARPTPPPQRPRPPGARPTRPSGRSADSAAQ